MVARGYRFRFKKLVSVIAAVAMIGTSFNLSALTAYADEKDAIDEEMIVEDSEDDEEIEAVSEENDAEEAESKTDDVSDEKGATSEAVSLYVHSPGGCAPFWAATPALVTWDTLTDESGAISATGLFGTGSYYELSPTTVKGESSWYNIDFYLSDQWTSLAAIWNASVESKDDVLEIYSSATGTNAISTAGTYYYKGGTLYTSESDIPSDAVIENENPMIYVYADDLDKNDTLYFMYDSWSNLRPATEVTRKLSDPDGGSDIWPTALTPVDGAVNWYSLELVTNGTKDGFRILKTTDSDSTDCTLYLDSDEVTEDMGSDVEELFAGDYAAAAIKTNASGKKIAYVDTETNKALEGILSEITVHVSCSDGIPGLCYSDSGVSVKTVDETDGSVKTLESVTEEAWISEERQDEIKYYYAMDADGSDGYSITYIPDDDNVKFDISYPNEWNWLQYTSFSICDVDLTDVAVPGNNIYIAADGTITSDLTTYTLGDLYTLYTGDAKRAYNLGEAAYTSGWSDFAAAYTAAGTLCDGASEESEDTSDEIAAAYDDLKSALEALVMGDRVVTVHYYSADDISAANSDYKVKPWGDKLTATDITVSEYTGFYDFGITLKDGVDSSTGFTICYDNWSNEIYTTWGGTLFPAILECATGDEVFFYNNEVYTSLDAIKAVWVTNLGTLAANAEKFNEEDYSEETFAELTAALGTAKNIIENDTEFTYNQVVAAYQALETAMDGLVSSVVGDISVSPVVLPDDFMTGADISSFYAIRQAGTQFKDENGKALGDQEFFNYLKAGGTNWARIRVWNNPYNSSGKGYGGGNNDIEKAVKLGKLATNAGMRVLIDFHYSDFWADPSKYKSPKAWADITDSKEIAQEVYDFTYDSLNKLISSGVDVGMVQVGNESNHGLAGWTDEAARPLYGAGCDAVHDAARELLGDGSEILAAVHFTDVQKGGGTVTGAINKQLGTYSNGEATSASYVDQNGNTRDEVEFDVIGVSYYPAYRHGDIPNLLSVLNNLEKTYGKKVYVAETSWATTWADGDGHSNSAPSLSGQDYESYSISVQGQADEVRAVVNTVNNVNDNAGLGVFYWEPAWISPYYACYDDYAVDSALYAKNQNAWEKYGAGWASSYSYEYDPTNAGTWYGGSGVDNQAWFDFEGKALPTAKIYKYIRSGVSREGDPVLISVDNSHMIQYVNVGDEADFDIEIKGTMSDGSQVTLENLVWRTADVKAVNTNKVGYYKVYGSAEYAGQKYAIVLNIQVTANFNVYLQNAGFETGNESPWHVAKIGGSGYTVAPTTENPKSGSFGLNFYRSAANLEVNAYQEVKNLPSGSYTFGGYVEGGSCAETDKQYAAAYVFDVSEGTSGYESAEALEADLEAGTLDTDKALACYKDSAMLDGWLSWKNPEVTEVEVSEGQILVVGFELHGTPSGSWGSIDDCYLFGTYGITKKTKNATITPSTLQARDNEVVKLDVKADTGYYLDEIRITCDHVTSAADAEKMSTSSTEWAYDTEGGYAYAKASGDTTSYTFRMPSGTVAIEANAKKLGVDTAIDLNTEYVSGNIIVKGLDDLYYTGRAVKPEVAVYYLGSKIPSTQYTVSYENNVEPTDAARVIIKGKGKTTGELTLTFRILATDGLKNIKNAKMTFVSANKVNTFYYTGDNIRPEVKITDGDTVLSEGVDYELSYYNNRKVGTAQIIAVGKGDYAASSISKKFKIVKGNIGDQSVFKYTNVTEKDGKLYLPSQAFTGKAIMPVVVINYNGNNLRSHKDFEYRYYKNKKVGTAHLVVSGIGKYRGKTKNIYFEITPASIDNTSIKVTSSDSVATKLGRVPKIKMKNVRTGVKLTRFSYKITELRRYIGADASVSENNLSGYELSEPIANRKVTDAGWYSATLEGRGNYTGTRNVNIHVVGKKNVLGKFNVSVINKSIYYTGEKITLTGADLRVTAGGKTLTEGVDYVIDEEEYFNNTSAGNAYFTVHGIGKYAGNVRSKFKILKRRVTRNADAKAKGAAVITAEIVSDTTYGTDQYYTGRKLTPRLLVTSKINGKSVPLTKGVDYTATFTHNIKGNDHAVLVIKGRGNYNGKIVFANFFTVIPRSLDDFIVTIEPVAYSPEKIIPQITFTDKFGVKVNLKKGVAYKVVYGNRRFVASKDAEKAPFAIIKEKGLGKGNKQIKKTFTITQAEILQKHITPVAPQTYRNGKAVTPELKIVVKGKRLKAGVDYTVTYLNNQQKTTQASAIVTGMGKYTGSVTVNFTIK